MTEGEAIVVFARERVPYRYLAGQMAVLSVEQARSLVAEEAATFHGAPTSAGRFGERRPFRCIDRQ